MELTKQQEGMTCKEKDESWDFQRSKRELSIQLPWNLNGLGCTSPAGPLQNPRLEKLNIYNVAKVEEWLGRLKVIRGCERLKLKKRDCFQWADAEGINKQ